MPTFTPQYTEPGVYVQFADVTVPAAPPGAFIPAIIGLGKKTLTIVEQVKKGAANSQDDLKKTPVFEIISITDKAGKTYVKDTDYVLTNDKVDWSPAGDEPITGSVYYVTYTYIKGDADYAPYLTTRQDTIFSLFGSPEFPNLILTGTATGGTSNTLTTGLTMTLNEYKGKYVKITSGVGVGQERLIVSNTTTGVLTVAPNWTTVPDNTSVYEINDISTNTLSIGAKICQQQGASYVLCVQAKDDTVTALQEAIDSLKNERCYVIVLMKGLEAGNSLISYLKNHVDQMSSLLERKFRISIIGAPINSTDVNDYITAATSIKHYRVAYLSPSDQIYTINNTDYTVDGSYLAAALAGIICNPNYTWAEPISGKSIISFKDIRDIFTRAEKNNMASNGVCIIEKKEAGDFRVRHALSTDPTSVATQELKVTRIKDGLAEYLIRNLTNAFINTRNLGSETIANITAFIKFLLGAVVRRNDIVEFRDLEVTQNPLEPRQIDVKFYIKPTLDINWIFITFGVTF